MKIKSLKEISFFDGIEEELLRQCYEKEEFHLSLAAGEQFAVANGNLCVLLSGRLHVLSADSGKTVILRTLCAGEVFGLATLFCQSEPFSKAEAESACELLLISENCVREMMEKTPAFSFRCLSFLSDRVRFLNLKIACFTAGSAERRLALWLLSEGKEELQISLCDLSDMLDIGRASLYRALDKLQADGLIKKDGRKLVLHHPDALYEKYKKE